MKLVKHHEFEVYYLKWPDGSTSDDFYNKTWANHHRRNIQARIDATMPFAGPTEPAGAFKLKLGSQVAPERKIAVRASY